MWCPPSEAVGANVPNDQASGIGRYRRAFMSARVVVDGAGVTVVGESGADTVAWTELEAVRVRTSDIGPFEDDLHWELQRRDGHVVSVGSETEGIGALIERLQRLPGFDNETMIAASASTLVALLGGQPDDDVLVLLERDWTGSRSYDFERLLRESGIPVSLSTW